ncbi:hypothetical protein M911_00980 [Ectothiorhodospira haloalkaliphila]|uniref:Phosphodiesterase n=1 Tax=Ectothiorhodospira haloalkaliphila TaxID=421628 RepID=W8L224_9GAMM|nr:alkaline phosphatase family protein [Ectothiorhodospira haloalkaliphila]AHK78005.1 hypothetical protein M911_00980 [Ectothiorhodospira haloalkaliphila]MCG5523816.1 alkaline phosphatase family protein [Ectothiorhodospira haloalkaliphila]
MSEPSRHPLPDPPDYQGGSLANLMSSLITGLGGTPSPSLPPLRLLPPDEISGHRHVVLVVVDGLGDEFLKSQPAPFLNTHRRGAIHSVFPTTTATGVTTVLTGDAPAQHGLSGWYVHFRELGSVLAVLPGTPRHGGVGYDRVNLDLRGVLGHRALFDRIPGPSAMAAPEKIARTPYNKLHLGKASLLPFKRLEDMVNRVDTAIRGRAGTRYVYAYWSELDTLGHHHGPDSRQTRDQLARVDEALARLARRLAGTDTLLVVTADHGMVDVLQRLDLSAYPEISRCLALPLCGEPRVAWAYVRHGYHEVFQQRVEAELGHACTVLPSRDLLEQGWFGPGVPHPELEARIGDFALIMHPGWIIHDRIPGQKPHDMVGVHGGLDPRELYIPLARTVC